MPTTKKVASKKVTALKKLAVNPSTAASVKSVVKSKTVAKKNMVKTTALPLSKSKLSIKDNTLEKQSTHKKTLTHGALIDSKLKNVEALQSRKPIHKELKPLLSKPRIPQLRPTFSLALLSPYRFPINAEHVAIRAARFGGTFFVALGAAFTLFFANGSFTASTQIATVTGALNTTVSNTSTTINCKDPLQYLSTSCASRVNKTPAVLFNAQTSSGVISEPTRIQVKVPNAQKVMLNAYYKTLTQELRFGTMSKVSNDTWEFFWDTTSFGIGDYKLKVLVTNGYGTYEALDTKYITLETKLFEEESELVSTPNSQNEATLDSESVHVEDPETVMVVDTVAELSEEVEETTDLLVEEPELKPEARISVLSSTPLKGAVGVRIDVAYGALIEVYVQNKSSLTKKFLGMASIYDKDTWNYRWDTTQTPNGEQRIVAVIKNRYGSYEVQSPFIKVYNEVIPAYTPKQEEQVRILSAIGTELKEMIPSPVGATAQTDNVVVPEPTTRTLSLEQDDIIKEAATVVPKPRVFEETISRFQKDVEAELQRFAIALRSKDQKAIDEAKTRLQKLKSTIILSEAEVEDVDELVEKLDEYVQLALTKIEDTVARSEKLIAERTPEKADIDSDKDGIADYDEVVLYKTNPFAADSDNDGFTDGAEILSGYDPTDGSSQTLVAYESPQESGVIREDILEVTSIATAGKNDEGDINLPPVAIISGKALPNSFVTLYIFSTPIVITLKTEADGSWNYRFDKELENGIHEVYVGVTDNSGKIVAKSKPFSFIKEAQAYTPVTEAQEIITPVASTENKSLLSTYMVYLVLSISVVAIGLVLILLGLHLDSRQRKYGLTDESREPTI